MFQIFAKKLAPKDASASNNSSEAIYFCQDLAHPLSFSLIKYNRDFTIIKKNSPNITTGRVELKQKTKNEYP